MSVRADRALFYATIAGHNIAFVFQQDHFLALINWSLITSSTSSEDDT